MSFVGPKWCICPKEELSAEKQINTILTYFLVPFIVLNLFKKSLEKILRVKSMEYDC